ncbi:MAG: Lrp/AsnC ligand binding domain-containing protein [Thaumarchaeota archaeon]|nr:Lrp/AsnC ligand binding domain-containing protein [Nitrososphaerota archaeon]
MPTTYILINSDLGSDVEIIKKIKQILDTESSVKYEVQGVYGVYDIIVKITADSMDLLRSIITNKIRKVDKVYSTLTMMVIEEQER